MKLFVIRISIALIILGLFNGLNILNAATLGQVVETGEKKISASVKSQKKIDKDVEASNQLLEEFRNVNQQIDGLKFYTQQLTAQVGNQQEIIDNLDYSISQISTIERQLPTLIQNMVSTLGQFVELDAPFHLRERQQRVAQLKSNLVRADISQAEKFRQVLEAYKIEIEYGRKIDSYEDTIELDGQSRQVNILRVGRIALMYQTHDRLKSGVWDRAK